MSAPANQLEVLDVGLQATVQDLGRPGFGFLGVPEAGAADAESLRLANRLVGNPESAAAIEILMGEFEAEFACNSVFAVAGAHCPLLLDNRPVAANSWAFAQAGQRLRIGRPTQGLRAYFAVGGGFDVHPVLGSRSTDTLSGIGPSPLRRGTVLAIGPRPPGPTGVPHTVVARTVSSASALEVVARLGPRHDLFPDDAIASLTAGPWHISQETDRIAARLLGPALLAAGDAQLPTEGLAVGSVQVPPSGQPIVHLANHPPTGGYPVIAVVDRAEVSRIAQSPPGTRIIFAFAPAMRFE